METDAMTIPRIPVKLYVPKMLLEFGSAIAAERGESFENFLLDSITIQICNPKPLYDLAMGDSDSGDVSRQPYPELERVYLFLPHVYEKFEEVVYCKLGFCMSRFVTFLLTTHSLRTKRLARAMCRELGTLSGHASGGEIFEN